MDDTITLRAAHSNISMKDAKENFKAAVYPTISRAETVTETPKPHPQVAHRVEVLRRRKIYLTGIFRGAAMLTFIIFGVFSLFWASLYRTPTGIHKMVGWVVDFDHGIIGNAVTSAVKELPFSVGTMTWEVKDASEFPGGPEELAYRIHDQDVWYAVSVNPGASDSLTAALASPQQHSNYSGSPAVTGYGEEARNDAGFKSIFRPQLDVLMQPIIANFAAHFAAENFAALSQDQKAAVLESAPQVVTRPIFYTLNNLRPFDAAVAPALTFVGMIYLLVLSFMVAMVSLGAREGSGLERALSGKRLVLLRMGTDFILYFFLSLFYGLVSLAFQVPFHRFLGHGGFVAYWMLQWIGMLALGYALETMVVVLTPKYMPLFLLLWIASDAAVSMMPIEVLPGVFRYGYAMPFYNISQGIRAIVFGTKNRLGFNFGVLFAWIAVSCFTLPASVKYSRYSHARSVAKAQAKQAQHNADAEAQAVQQS